MSCPCSFDPSLPFGCVMELVGIVRSGNLLSAKADVLKHAGCILGSIGAYIDQDTTPLMHADCCDLPCTLEEAAQECEAALAPIDGVPTMAINPSATSFAAPVSCMATESGVRAPTRITVVQLIAR